MDYTKWKQMQPNPNYTTDPNTQIPQIHQNPNYTTFPNPQNPQIHQNPNYLTNPNFHPHALTNQMQQNPNFETGPNAQKSYLYQNYCFSQSMNPNPVADHHNLGQPYNSAAQFSVRRDYSYQQTVNGPLPSSYVHHQNHAGFMANGHVAVNQYAFNANTLGIGTHQTYRPQNRGKLKKPPKKTIVVQSAWCDVCHIKCDTNDVLELHKQGKKHKKKLENSRMAARTVPIAPPPASAPVPVTVGTHTPTAAPISASGVGLLVAYAASVVPTIGPQENPDTASKASKKKKRQPSGPVENLETKKKKVVEGGAATEAIRTCSVCNVVCNSDTVYSYHLAGQKHASMMKKHALLPTVVANAL